MDLQVKIDRVLEYLQDYIKYDEETGVWNKLHYISKYTLVDIYNILMKGE